MSTTGSSTSGLSETLQFITNIKLQELEKQCSVYTDYAKIIDQAAATATAVDRAEILLDAVCRWTGSGSLDSSDNVGGRLDIRNLRIWIEQARTDPSISEGVVLRWVEELEQHIKHVGQRFDSAKLFGNLLNEWLVDERSLPSDEEGAAIAVGRKEMYEQRDKLNSLIFTPRQVDIPALEAYLSDLFASPEVSSHLADLRASIDKELSKLQSSKVMPENVEAVIGSIIADKNMSDAKRDTLRDFLDSPIVLQEIASVLTMRLASVGSWTWPAEGMLMEMRRALNGKYRAFTDPELVDMMFVQFVGLKLQSIFKRAVRTFCSSRAWKPSSQPLTKEQISRRKTFLGEDSALSDAISSHRTRLRKETFIVGQLVDVLSTDRGDDDDDNAYSANTNVPLELLHLVATECQLSCTLHGRFTVLATDLEWYGPSLPQSTFFTVLKFLGFSETWLTFLRSFFEMPLRFLDQQLRVRRCGTPVGYALSTLVGEAVLFIMDFAVNQSADGLFLYRNHDDLWLFDPNADRCVLAWAEMQRYAALAGITFNGAKTGSASVGEAPHPGLPVGDVRWGLLKFNAGRGGFDIDDAQVDAHIEELERQLRTARTVFATVSCWNKYNAFLVRQFGGQPAYCLGADHAQAMISALARLQTTKLFPKGSGLVGHLREIICQRFGVQGLPEGYFYLPITTGGLGLRTPLPELFAVKKRLSEDESTFEKAVKADRARYDALKEQWQERADDRSYRESSQEFMSFEEFIEARETRLLLWGVIFEHLMDTPQPESVYETPATKALFSQSSSNWNTMDFQDRWVAAVHGEEIVKRFGSLDSVDPTLIPLGMVKLFTQSRMKWDQ